MTQPSPDAAAHRAGPGSRGADQGAGATEPRVAAGPPAASAGRAIEACGPLVAASTPPARAGSRTTAARATRATRLTVTAVASAPRPGRRPARGGGGRFPDGREPGVWRVAAVLVRLAEPARAERSITGRDGRNRPRNRRQSGGGGTAASRVAGTERGARVIGPRATGRRVGTARLMPIAARRAGVARRSRRGALGPGVAGAGWVAAAGWVAGAGRAAWPARPLCGRRAARWPPRPAPRGRGSPGAIGRRTSRPSDRRHPEGGRRSWAARTGRAPRRCPGPGTARR